MSLADLVNVTISATTSTPTKPGFGTILIAAQKVPAAFVARVMTFSSVLAMTQFGFGATDPAVLCASAILAQNPTVTSFKVAKRANKLTQTIHLTCTSATQGDTYSITVNGTAITYTVPASATTTTVATAIAALIAAVSGVTATSAVAVITVTVTAGAGLLNDFKLWSTNLQFADVTTDPGGTTGLLNDLNAILAYDNNWYGLALDSNSAAEIAIAASFTETNKKLFVPSNSDYECTDPASTTDCMYLAKTAAYARTGILYSGSQLLSYSGPAWMGRQFTQTPGSDNWAYKTLAGILADTITENQRSAILGKNGNCYEPVSGVNITEFGESASGEWFDLTRFIDWQAAEIQFRVFNVLLNNSKVPYTDQGGDMIAAAIDGALDEGIAAGGLVKGSTTVTVPLVANVDPGTRNTRVLPNVTFSGQLAGAINTLTIQGTLTT